MKSLSLEARVGLLILVAVGLLGAFVFTLNPSLIEEGYLVYVDFNNPGGLKGGAPVNIGGIRIGRIEGVDYLGGKEDPITKRRPMIRVRARINREYLDTIYEDARFYVTSTSIVGESIMAIDPGDPRKEPLGENAYVIGIDPPRMDLAFAKAYELLETISSLLVDNREDLEGLVKNASSLLGSLNEIMTKHGDRVDRIIENVESISDEANELVAGANKIVNGPRVARILRNVDESLAVVNRDIDPIMKDVRSITHKVDDALDMIGPKQQEQVKSILEDGAAIAADAKAMVSHIRQGRGTVGAILMDEAMYDDIQEMLRDLKHNPWKLFWRE
ncbi:MAG: MCE family protein [Myxococcales bacterium]|nr:MCE family protein [Myxococcales bacterium]